MFLSSGWSREYVCLVLKAEIQETGGLELWFVSRVCCLVLFSFLSSCVLPLWHPSGFRMLTHLMLYRRPQWSGSWFCGLTAWWPTTDVMESSLQRWISYWERARGEVGLFVFHWLVCVVSVRSNHWGVHTDQGEKQLFGIWTAFWFSNPRAGAVNPRGSDRSRHLRIGKAFVSCVWVWSNFPSLDKMSNVDEPSAWNWIIDCF